MHAHLAEAISFDESFAIGLDAIVAGFPEPVVCTGAKDTLLAVFESVPAPGNTH